MTPLTTRARELAARERKLYDQRTIPAVLEELADEVERLTAVEAEHTELSNLFDMQFDADARAVKEWRDNNPSNDLVWPDSARLAVWALEQMSSAMAEADKLRAEAANIAAQRDEAEKRAEVAEERLRAKEADLAAAREECREAVMQALASMGQAQEAYEAQLVAEAELARIRAADRTSITVRTTEAAKMRKGQAI